MSVADDGKSLFFITVGLKPHSGEVGLVRRVGLVRWVGFVGVLVFFQFFCVYLHF